MLFQISLLIYGLVAIAALAMTIHEHGLSREDRSRAQLFAGLTGCLVWPVLIAGVALFLQFRSRAVPG